MNPWKLVRQRQGPEISDGYQPMKLRRKLPRSNFELPHDSLWFRVRAGCRDARSALSNRTCCASSAVDDCSGARLGASEVIGPFTLNSEGLIGGVRALLNGKSFVWRVPPFQTCGGSVSGFNLPGNMMGLATLDGVRKADVRTRLGEFSASAQFRFAVGVSEDICHQLAVNDNEFARDAQEAV